MEEVGKSEAARQTEINASFIQLQGKIILRCIHMVVKDDLIDMVVNNAAFSKVMVVSLYICVILYL